MLLQINSQLYPEEYITKYVVVIPNESTSLYNNLLKYYGDIYNICGERLLRQYKHFMAKGLSQQNRYLLRQVVVTTDKIFVARG